jgi:hypothetical protein
LPKFLKSEPTALTCLVLICFLSLPSLFLLSSHVQGPDGAEMLSTALRGGVMHPSGMPFQAWLNRLFAFLFRSEPAWGLSLVSWLGYFTACLGLTAYMREFRLTFFEHIAIVGLFAFYPIFWSLALQPEKYTWIAALLIWLFVFMIRSQPLGATILMSLAMAQHSACFVFLPSFMLFLYRSQKTLYLPLSFCITAGFYISLLGLRSSYPWPDWGALDSLKDVFNHIFRTDYGVINLHNRQFKGTLNGLEALFSDIVVWNGALALLPIGLFTILKRKTFRDVLVLLGLTSSLVILFLAELPDQDSSEVRAYLERYPILVLPFLSFLLVHALDGITQFRVRLTLSSIAVLACIYQMSVAWPLAFATSTELSFVYKTQVESELISSDIFFSQSDFDLFLGFSCGGQACFPVKNLLGLKWYRESTLPRLQPKLHQLIVSTQVSSFSELMLEALKNQSLVSTSASLFYDKPEVMAKAEQVGLTWRFSAANQSLYTRNLLINSSLLCEKLKLLTIGLDEKGPRFNFELLKNIKYVYLSSSDYLNFLGFNELAKKASELAQQLEPGANISRWSTTCTEYQHQLGQAKVLY